MRTAMTDRENAAWVRDLSRPGEEQEAALADLRDQLRRALPRGMSRWLSPAHAEFNDFVEDTIQETLSQALNKLDSFEGRGQFTSWAYKIAVRLGLNELRRRKWRDVSLDYLEEGSDEIPAFQFASPEASPETQTEHGQLMEKMENIIRTALTEKQRRAMVAVVVQEVPMEVVAKRMGSNRNAVYKLLHDARQKLKSELEKEGLAPEDLLSMFAE